MDVKNNKEIKEEVHSANPKSGKHKAWIVSYIIFALVCLAIYFLLQFQVFNLLGTYRSLFQRLALAGFAVFVIFIITRGIESEAG